MNTVNLNLLPEKKPKNIVVETKIQKKIGVENIKLVFNELFELEKLIKQLFDGVTILEISELGFDIADLYAKRKLFVHVLAEFKDLSPKESIIIIDHFKGKFNLHNEPLEQKIENILDLIPRMYEYIKYLLVNGVALYSDIKNIFNK